MRWVNNPSWFKVWFRQSVGVLLLSSHSQKFTSSLNLSKQTIIDQAISIHDPEINIKELLQTTVPFSQNPNLQRFSLAQSALSSFTTK